MFADFDVQLMVLQILPLPSPRFQAGREDHSLKHSSYVPWFTGIFSKTAVMDQGWYFLRFDILSYLTWWALAWCYLADICQNIWCHCLPLVVPCCFYGCCLNDINSLVLSCGFIVLLYEKSCNCFVCAFSDVFVFYFGSILPSFLKLPNNLFDCVLNYISIFGDVRLSSYYWLVNNGHVAKMTARREYEKGENQESTGRHQVCPSNRQ